MIKCEDCKLNLKSDNFCVVWLGEACGWQWMPFTGDYKNCHRNTFPDSYLPPIVQQPLSNIETSDNGKRCRK